MKTILPIIVFVLTINYLYSQTNESVNYYEDPNSIEEVIQRLGSDSVILYYNSDWKLVKPSCASIFRISKMDKALSTFTGQFIDYFLADSTIAIEGNYSNGKKEGRFIIYYPNGQPAQFGNYINNKKSGVWEYFYEDGTKRQILDFQDNEILIKEFWNEKGKKLVESGNGEWFTYESSEKFVKTSGNVLNGRKNGTWKNTIPSRNMTINIEKYKEGKFVSGKTISIIGGTESYKDTHYCFIENTLTFLTAEKFQMYPCTNIEKSNFEAAKFPGGEDKFFKEIQDKIVLNESMLKRGVISVRITIDTDGKMIDFEPLSNIGHEFELIQILKSMSKWIPAKINGIPTTENKIINFEIR